MPMDKTVYIFDIDDTLYLERDYVKSGFEAIGQATQCAAFGDACWELFCQGVRGNTFDLTRRDFAHLDLPPTPALVDIYRSHRPNIALCDDARRFIEAQREPMGIISDGPIRAQRAKYQALGLAIWIDFPIFTAEIGAPKPNPQAFKIAALALGAPLVHIVYVADNPAKDFEGAICSGIEPIRMRRHQSLHARCDTPKGIREITSFDEL